MARLRVPAALRVDRHYRGARVELSGRTFVLREGAIRCLELVGQAALEGKSECVEHELDARLLAPLLEVGVLEWSE